MDATRNNNNENNNNDFNSNNSNNHTEPFVSDDPGIVTEIQRMHASIVEFITQDFFRVLSYFPDDLF